MNSSNKNQQKPVANEHEGAKKAANPLVMMPESLAGTGD